MQNNAYNFVDRDLRHIEEIIKTIVDTDQQIVYPVAHDLVVEFATVAAEFFMAWTAVESWAAAICQPWGKRALVNESSCTLKEADDVGRGLKEFEKSYKTPFIEKLKGFHDSMNDPTFVTKRQQGKFEARLNFPFGCGPHGVEMRKQFFEGGVNSQFSHWSKTAYQIRQDMICDWESTLHGRIQEAVCGGHKCTTKLVSLKCNHRACDFSGCSRRFEPKVCEPCGWYECEEKPLEVEARFDHMQQSLLIFEMGLKIVRERSMTHLPPYRLPEGSLYHMEYDFRSTSFNIP